uniref:RNA-directed RNA polymerase L n=1 Tax=Anthurium amnicola TaxID=1678845 RepID=A0A1D1YBD0_9ARAE
MRNNMKKKTVNQTTSTPYSIYGFFRSFRESLADENDFSDFISTLTITPMKAVVEMVLPFFHRSSDPNLLTQFQILIRQAEQNSDFESTLMRVCDAIDMLEKVEVALHHDKRLMNGYLKAMQFDNASASHQQVWSGLQRFLNEECDPTTKRGMERVFAEQKASEELGLSDDVLATAHALVGDDSLYIGILETLQLNNRQNLPWDTVIKRIQRLIEDKKPRTWPMLRRFLDDVHSGRGIDEQQFNYYWNYIDEQYFNEQYYNNNQQYINDQYFNDDQYINDQYTNEEESETQFIEQKFSNIKLESENDGVNVIEPPQTQEAQRKQQREVVF